MIPRELTSVLENKYIPLTNRVRSPYRNWVRDRVFSSLIYSPSAKHAGHKRGSVTYIIIWLAPRAGKRNQIARCDWLPERARRSHLARSGLPAVSRNQIFTKSHIINPLLTKFVRSRWLDIGLVLFLRVMDLDFVSVHKHAKKELGQYPAILTEQTWSITRIYVFSINLLAFYHEPRSLIGYATLYSVIDSE